MHRYYGWGSASTAGKSTFLAFENHHEVMTLRRKEEKFTGRREDGMDLISRKPWRTDALLNLPVFL